MASVEQPLVEALSILSDFCRLRTWQILNQQAYNAVSGPRLLIETTPTGNNFTVHYWPDSYVLSFDSLALGHTSMSKDREARKDGKKAGTSVEDYRAKLPPPHLILTTHTQTMSTVEIKHKPPLIGVDGRVMTFSLSKDDINLASLVQECIAEHAKCR